MVCGDLETFGRDEEKDVVLFPHDLDVGFIACADGIDRPFVFQVNAVAIEGSGGGIVEHSLGGDSDIEYGPQDEGSLSGADGKGYVEGKDKAEDIGRVVDFDEIHTGSPRGGMDQFSWSVMIFPILVAELKLGTSFFRKGIFCIIECIHLPYPVETMVIAALVEGNLFSLFPGKQCMVAVGAVILRFSLVSPVQLEEVATHLAHQLSSFFAVVVIEIVMGSAAAGTSGMFRHSGGA
jgi:hypothetical protein